MSVSRISGRQTDVRVMSASRHKADIGLLRCTCLLSAQSGHLVRDEKPFTKTRKVLQLGCSLLNHLERRSHSFTAKLL